MSEDSRLKVLHIIGKCGIGGMERSLYLLVKSLLKNKDLKIDVLFSQPGGYYYEQIKKLECGIINVSIRRGFDLTKTYRVIKMLRNYDIHHFHNSHFPLIIASILSPHKVRILTYRGGKHQFGIVKWLRERIIKVILNIFFHKLTANTLHAAETAAKLYGIPVANITVTYNVIDFDLVIAKISSAYLRKKLGINDRIVIGSAANFKKWKRLDMLIRLISELQGDDVKLLLVGDGRERKRLISLARALGVADRAIFTGMRENIFDYMNIMDIFILPSDSGESFGNAAVEAMALGIPCVVCADGGGLIEHIVNRKTGYIAKSFDDMVQITKKLKGDYSLRTSIGQAGRKYIIRKYDPSTTTKVFCEIYSSFSQVAR